MSMVRYLLADNFGFSWSDIKTTPCHIVKQYINDIEKSKNHFRGLHKGDASRYAAQARAAGVPL